MAIRRLTSQERECLFHGLAVGYGGWFSEWEEMEIFPKNCVIKIKI